jgi:hypothetical protein
MILECVRREWGKIEGGEESRKNTPPFVKNSMDFSPYKFYCII